MGPCPSCQGEGESGEGVCSLFILVAVLLLYTVHGFDNCYLLLVREFLQTISSMTMV